MPSILKSQCRALGGHTLSSLATVYIATAQPFFCSCTTIIKHLTKPFISFQNSQALSEWQSKGYTCCHLRNVYVMPSKLCFKRIPIPAASSAGISVRSLLIFYVSFVFQRLGSQVIFFKNSSILWKFTVIYGTHHNIWNIGSCNQCDCLDLLYVESAGMVILSISFSWFKHVIYLKPFLKSKHKWCTCRCSGTHTLNNFFPKRTFFKSL